MKQQPKQRQHRINRRAFLHGAAGVSVALPFLESLPERSAWAADEEPIFAFFMCAVGGVIPASFFPAETGPLTAEGLAGAGCATSQLALHADQLSFLKGIDWPMAAAINDAHTQGLCMVLTGRPPEGGGPTATSQGPSADFEIASRVHPGSDPLVLYAGNLKDPYAAQRLSFSAAGQLAPAVDNPYTLYQELVGLAAPGMGMTPDGEEAARLLLESRNSIHDLVRDDLNALMSNSRMSSADRERLQLHFDAIRDAEVTMDGMGDEALEWCTAQGLDVDKLEALQTFKYDPHATEQIVLLHMSLVALAFACNYRRSASLQWGDPYDRTIYDVPSNLDRQWPFSFISHQMQSDALAGEDAQAAAAHAEIDVVRMQTLAAGLEHFKARELQDRAFVMWTNCFVDGQYHSFSSVPHILWGNAGGVLKQGEYIDCGNTTNNRLLNTLITAAIQDTGEIVDDFGEGTGGQLEEILA